MVNNIFHKTVTDLTASQVKRVPITLEERQNVGEEAFNFIVVYNNSDALIHLIMNDNVEEKIPLGPSGGKFAFDPETRLLFHSLQVEDASGSGATGDIFITYGTL